MHSPSPHRCPPILARTVRPLAPAIRCWRPIRGCSQQLLPEALSLLLPLNRSAAPLPILSVPADYAVGMGARLCEPDCSPRRYRPSRRSLLACWFAVWPLSSSSGSASRQSRCWHCHKPGARGQAGRQPRRGRRHGQQCFLCRGSRAQCERDNDFFALRQVPLNAPVLGQLPVPGSPLHPAAILMIES